MQASLQLNGRGRWWPRVARHSTHELALRSGLEDEIKVGHFRVLDGKERLLNAGKLGGVINPVSLTGGQEPPTIPSTSPNLTFVLFYLFCNLIKTDLRYPISYWN